MPEAKFPERLVTERLEIRVVRPEDAAAVNAATRASYPELHEWMDWAMTPPTMEQSAAFCSTAHAAWLDNQDFSGLMFLRGTSTLIGSAGYVRPDWRVPRNEIGYWCATEHTGNGYVTEASLALTRHAFEALGMVRVEIRTDARNRASYSVAERLGYQLEATLKRDARANDGSLRNTRVYVRFNADGLA